jgi:adenosylhomocysteine nucleosidase
MFNPVSVEMEGAAIAHACYINKVPFISVRSISDKADDSAKDSYKENEIPAANEAGKFVLSLLDNISNLV